MYTLIVFLIGFKVIAAIILWSMYNQYKVEVNEWLSNWWVEVNEWLSDWLVYVKSELNIFKKYNQHKEYKQILQKRNESRKTPNLGIVDNDIWSTEPELKNYIEEFENDLERWKHPNGKLYIRSPHSVMERINKKVIGKFEKEMERQEKEMERRLDELEKRFWDASSD